MYTRLLSTRISSAAWLRSKKPRSNESSLSRAVLVQEFISSSMRDESSPIDGFRIDEILVPFLRQHLKTKTTTDSGEDSYFSQERFFPCCFDFELDV